MLTEPAEDKLGDTYHVTVVVRLVLNQHGNLKYGEIMDAEGLPHGRFVEWFAMTREIRDWLIGQAPGER